MTDTVSVSFEVIEFRRLHGAGKLVASATVEVDLGGIQFLLHGVQIIRLPNGRLQARAPHYRSPTGQWLPAVTLPVELETAIGRELLAAFGDPCT